MVSGFVGALDQYRFGRGAEKQLSGDRNPPNAIFLVPPWLPKSHRPKQSVSGRLRSSAKFQFRRFGMMLAFQAALRGHYHVRLGLQSYFQTWRRDHEAASVGCDIVAVATLGSAADDSKF